MDKVVRRLLLGDLSNIEEYEEYFSDMSREGLHLQKVGKIFAYFKEGEPKNLKYRIDIAREKQIEEKKEKHKEKGWNFVAAKDSFLVFSIEQSSNLKELYETPEEHISSFIDAQEEIIKDEFNNVIMQGLVIIVIVSLIYFQISMSGGLYLSLTEENEIYRFIFITLLPFFSYGKKRKNLKRIEDTLESGEFLRHEGDYSSMSKKFVIKKSIATLLVLIGFILIYYRGTNFEIIELSPTDDLDKLPMVTIETIEKDNLEDKTNDIYEIKYPTRSPNFIRKEWSPFAPKNYILIQSVILKNQDEESSDAKAFLKINYYLTRFEFIAKGLEEDINRERNKYGINFEKLQGEKDMSIHSFEKENTIYLLMRKDKEVIFLEYENGRANLEEIIQVVKKKMGDE